jgi:general secretion pathway protein K
MNSILSRPARRATGSDGERGLALLVVLWIIASAALLVSAFNATVRSGVAVASSELQLARVEGLLDAGAEIAATRLIDEEATRRWAADGKQHRVSFAGAEIAISIDDPNGLVDLNKADKELLLGLLRQFARSEQNANRVRDRILAARGEPRSANEMEASTAGRGVGGEAAASNRARSYAFIDVAQLRRIEGVDLDLYRQIAPFLTVYGRDGRINPTVAPVQVLASIPGLTTADVERLRVASRARQPNHAALSGLAQRAGTYLGDVPGPAYVVSVVAAPAGGYRAGKSFVLVTGLDADAPYRLIAIRPLALRD